MNTLKLFTALLAAATLVLGKPSFADLKPEQIAVLAAAGDRESAGLAAYYCRQRDVPRSHVIDVTVPGEEEMTREDWRSTVRPQVRSWLAKNDPDHHIRCLVTTWGVPLKISALAESSPAGERHLAYLRAEHASRLDTLQALHGELERVAVESLDGPIIEGISPSGGLAKVREQLEGALKAALKRIFDLPPEQRRSQEARLQKLATSVGGTAVLIQSLGKRVEAARADGAEAPLATIEQLSVMRGRTGAFAELRILLDSRPPGVDRDELSLRLLEQVGGQLACVGWLEEQIRIAEQRQTASSFDSELSLVLWDPDYDLLRWQPNYLRASYASTQVAEAFPTLMVARLDGPDLPTAKRLIDDAIAVEKAGGLHGKAYFDARGLTTLSGRRHEPGSFPDFDRSVLRCADMLQAWNETLDEPRIPVVLNELPELFSPGQCPEAALYCGWYSLAKYVDAFDFNRGAIAYHLASAEAETLKELDSQVWCKKLLEDGVAATIGPVNEPYLIAFPRPADFFGLLVRGDLTLAEVFYRTKPFNSWQMVLIGDPLYRPFANEP